VTVTVTQTKQALIATVITRHWRKIIQHGEAY